MGLGLLLRLMSVCLSAGRSALDIYLIWTTHHFMGHPEKRLSSLCPFPVVSTAAHLDLCHAWVVFLSDNLWQEQRESLSRSNPPFPFHNSLTPPVSPLLELLKTFAFLKRIPRNAIYFSHVYYCYSPLLYVNNKMRLILLLLWRSRFDHQRGRKECFVRRSEMQWFHCSNLSSISVPSFYWL